MPSLSDLRGRLHRQPERTGSARRLRTDDPSFGTGLVLRAKYDRLKQRREFRIAFRCHIGFGGLGFEQESFGGLDDCRHGRATDVVAIHADTKVDRVIPPIGTEQRPNFDECIHRQ